MFWALAVAVWSSAGDRFDLARRSWRGYSGLPLNNRLFLVWVLLRADDITARPELSEERLAKIKD